MANTRVHLRPNHSTRLNVLFISPSSLTGGGQRWLQLLAEGLPKYGIRPFIIFSRWGHPGTIFHNLLRPYVAEELCYQHDTEYWPQRVAALIHNHDIHVVVIEHHERADEILALCERRPAVIFVDHTMDDHTVKELKSIDSSVDLVVCVSRKIAAKITWRPVTVIHNACPPVPSLGTDVRRMLRIPKEAFVVGYIGRLDGNKGVLRLACAAEERGWWLLLVGNGPLLHKLSHRNPRFRVFPVDVYHVGDFYAAMNVFVLPSLAEGFPFAPLEALACGCRVAMTHVSDFPEIFGDSIAFFDHKGQGIFSAVEQAPPPEQAQEIMKRRLPLSQMIRTYARVIREVATRQ